MSGENFDLYLTIMMAICLVMALVNVARIKQRPKNATVMAIAFVAFAATLYGLKVSASQALIFVGAVVVGVCLVLDAVFKAERRREEGK